MLKLAGILTPSIFNTNVYLASGSNHAIISKEVFEVVQM